jgi:hypothetical protein
MRPVPRYFQYLLEQHHFLAKDSEKDQNSPKWLPDYQVAKKVYGDEMDIASYVVQKKTDELVKMLVKKSKLFVEAALPGKRNKIRTAFMDNFMACKISSQFWEGFCGTGQVFRDKSTAQNGHTPKDLLQMFQPPLLPGMETTSAENEGAHGVPYPRSGLRVDSTCRTSGKL